MTAAIQKAGAATGAEIVVDEKLAREHGLTGEEFARLHGFLGRNPTFTELGITSALWSEHCSYKSSKIYLREFPTSGSRVLQGPGENAGVVDIGHGWVADALEIGVHNGIGIVIQAKVGHDAFAQARNALE